MKFVAAFLLIFSGAVLAMEETEVHFDSRQIDVLSRILGIFGPVNSGPPSPISDVTLQLFTPNPTTGQSKFYDFLNTFTAGFYPKIATYIRKLLTPFESIIHLFTAGIYPAGLCAMPPASNPTTSTPTTLPTGAPGGLSMQSLMDLIRSLTGGSNTGGGSNNPLGSGLGNDPSQLLASLGITPSILTNLLNGLSQPNAGTGTGTGNVGAGTVGITVGATLNLNSAIQSQGMDPAAVYSRLAQMSPGVTSDDIQNILNGLSADQSQQLRNALSAAGSDASQYATTLFSTLNSIALSIPGVLKLVNDLSLPSPLPLLSAMAQIKLPFVNLDLLLSGSSLTELSALFRANGSDLIKFLIALIQELGGSVPTTTPATPITGLLSFVAGLVKGLSPVVINLLKTLLGPLGINLGDALA